MKKQLGTCQYPLYFRVKFYVSDPSKLQEEYTRYQFYLQLRRDILEERLQLAPSTAILLASYTVQCKYLNIQEFLKCFRNNFHTNLFIIITVWMIVNINIPLTKLTVFHQFDVC